MSLAYTHIWLRFVVAHFALVVGGGVGYSCRMTRSKPNAEPAAAAGKPTDAPQSRAAKAAKKGKAGAATAESGGAARAREVGGRNGPEPTRYGDWENNGRCVDF